MIEHSIGDGYVILSVRVVPRASRTEIVGEHDGALKVRLAAPPVDGAANDELVRIVAKRLGVPRSAVEVTSGQRSKSKQVKVWGVTDSIVELLKGVG